MSRQLSMYSKNTFLDVQEEPQSGSRRSASTPPSVGGRAQEPTAAEAAVAAQLRRLDAILRDGAKPTWWQTQADVVGSTAVPSVGSAGHGTGSCRPCAFVRSASGCKFAASCKFCHLVTDHPEAVRVRPCKGKRERFKRTLAAIEARVASDPGILSGDVGLPPFFDGNPRARARMMAHLVQVAAVARHELDITTV